MKKTIIASLLLAYFTGGLIPVQAANLDSTETGSTLNSSEAMFTQNGREGFKTWLPDLMQTFNALPEVAAQQARRTQAKLSVQAADQAIYNPELGMNYQNATDDTYSLDISQTIDWGDKRGAATRIAQLQTEILLSDITLERSQMLANVIQALVEQSQSRKALNFQQQQLASAKRSLDIAKQQLQVGDLSSVALQLVQLDVASRAAEYALAEQDSISADASVLILLGNSETAFSGFIGSLRVPTISMQIDPELPALKSAYQQVMLTKLSADQVKADTSADPTISLSAEREGVENKVGVGFSIPLQIRNNYSDTLAVASQEIAIAEQTYLAQERVLKQQQQKFYLAMPRLTERYQDWRELVLNSGHEAASGLAQQWRAGDIETSVYLQSQRQLSTSYLAGLSLETALYTSWLEWMGASGQLETYLNAQLPGLSEINHAGADQNGSSAQH
ncbi:outer membrane protein [Shewanella psychrophila]|uniref:Outer membrane protein n=1 Tax=Shewanella psychrophila TaxID=225848 RepID=A0A1S6HRM7_9GAMM|nr:TolC family protein [Shewanella psychrophila]AQS38173.1 outer membrane protein [Shewanella psychrophila]